MTRAEDPDDGLAFDFLAPDAPPPGHLAAPLMTGHANGLITLSLAEADDVERERQRTQMGEPYRTLLGHFRHEIAHYYWDRLIANSPSIDEFRKIFGDEREDYGAALQRHYANGPPPIGTSTTSPHMPARIRGRTSRRPGRTTSTWSTPWKPHAPSG